MDTDGMERPASEREKLLERHKRETKELRGKIQALKKGIPKGDKRRKKEVGAEIAILEQEVESRHTAELAQVAAEDMSTSSGTAAGSSENGVSSSGTVPGSSENGIVEEGMGRMNTKDGQEEGGVAEGGVSAMAKKSKAQKRKAKKAQQERERAQRILEMEAAESTEINPRQQERERLRGILTPLGLVIKDINPDGHCLYAAISDQLSVKTKIKVSVSELRSQCSEYIRDHCSDFLPYLTHHLTGNQFTQEQFEEYCREIAETAAWGGQLEILAFSHIYKVPIDVYQASSPLMCVGEEYKEQEQPLKISYHLHEFGLGEHYNSVLSSDT